MATNNKPLIKACNLAIRNIKKRLKNEKLLCKKLKKHNATLIFGKETGIKLVYPYYTQF